MVGKISLFAFDTVRHAVTPPWYPSKILAQFMSIGFFSLAVVGMTALFSGMVIALQSYTGFARFNAEGAVANVVVLTITRELAPVLAGLMLAARVGASIAAEIGGLIKAAVFGLIVTLMGCYNGYNSGRGAQGVGLATTNAVVSSAILILIFNYLLTQILFS